MEESLNPLDMAEGQERTGQAILSKKFDKAEKGKDPEQSRKGFKIRKARGG
jgi:hypothetical protein